MFRPPRSHLHLLSAFALLATLAHGQNYRIRWGDIPMEDLMMTAHVTDTNAAVIILADIGKVWFDNQRNLIFEQYMRIKILNERGYDYAERTLLYNRQNREKYSGIRGTTYTLQADGKIRTTDMTKDHIFKTTELNKIRVIKFTLPDLSPGCIIELSYKKIAESPHAFPDWHFQGTEPVRYSELSAQVPAYYEYAFVLQGGRPLDIVTRKTALIFTGLTRTMTKFTWGMKNIPALRSESYISTLDDYLARLRVQLKAYRDQIGRRVPFLQTWDKLTSKLLMDNQFGRQLRPQRVYRAALGRMQRADSKPRRLMMAVHRFIVSNFAHRTSTAGPIFAEQSIRKVFKNRAGTDAELTYLFISMLRSAGIEAYPVIYSSRGHGRIMDAYPLISQFNRVLAAVIMDAETTYVLPTNANRPYDMVPSNAHGRPGLLLRNKKGGHEWVVITNQRETTAYRRFSVSGRLDTAGTLTASLTARLDGYPAINARGAIQRHGLDEYLEDFLEGNLPGGATFDSGRVSQLDDFDKELELEFNFTIPRFATRVENLVYFNPSVLTRWSQSPLSQPERLLPLEFHTQPKEHYVVTVTLPEGLRVLELPADFSMVTEDVKSKFTFRAASYTGVVNLQQEILRIRTFYEPAAYSMIYEFYTRVADANNAQVLLEWERSR